MFYHLLDQSDLTAQPHFCVLHEVPPKYLSGTDISDMGCGASFLLSPMPRLLEYSPTGRAAGPTVPQSSLGYRRYIMPHSARLNSFGMRRLNVVSLGSPDCNARYDLNILDGTRHCVSTVRSFSLVKQSTESSLSMCAYSCVRSVLDMKQYFHGGDVRAS